jgi:hypothetical protein
MGRHTAGAGTFSRTTTPVRSSDVDPGQGGAPGSKRTPNR